MALENFICVACIAIALLIGSIVSVITISIYIDGYHYTKHHGVHKTNFTFTGHYAVVIETNDNGYTHYASLCESITPFGDCYYECYKSNVEQDARNYAIEYCNTSTTLDGYIVNDIDRCVETNPNNKIYKHLMALRVLGSYILLNAFVCVMCIVGGVCNDMSKSNPQMGYSSGV